MNLEKEFEQYSKLFTDKDHWALDEYGEPIRTNLIDSAMCLENDKRQIGHTQLPKGVFISTAFIPTYYVLWETMVFGGHFDGYQRRYKDRAAAFQGHKETVVLVILGWLFSERKCHAILDFLQDQLDL